MTALVVSYAVLFLAAIAIGFFAGAALQRAARADHLADLEGDVQALRKQVGAAKAAEYDR